MNDILQALKRRVEHAQRRLDRPTYYADHAQAMVRLNGELSNLVKEQAAYIGALEATLEEREQAVQS